MSQRSDYSKNDIRLENDGRTPLWIILALILGAAIISFSALYFFLQPDEQEITITTPDIPLDIPQPAPEIVQPTPVPAQEPVVAAPVEPEPTAPIPEKEPLPNLYSSDDHVLEELNNTNSGAALSKLIVPESLIQRFVRVVVALHEEKLVHDYRPIKSPIGELNTIAIDEPLNPDIGQRYYLSTQNYNRYENWITVFEALDKKMLANIYQKYYPLLQEAYEQHGAKISEFDTVLKQIIDQCLAVGSVQNRPILIQQKVVYQYQDEKLENQSDLVKLLTRMGPSNTDRLQNSLKQMKAELDSLSIN